MAVKYSTYVQRNGGEEGIGDVPGYCCYCYDSAKISDLTVYNDYLYCKSCYKWHRRTCPVCEQQVTRGQEYVTMRGGIRLHQECYDEHRSYYHSEPPEFIIERLDCKRLNKRRWRDYDD